MRDLNKNNVDSLHRFILLNLYFFSQKNQNNNNKRLEMRINKLTIVLKPKTPT